MNFPLHPLIFNEKRNERDKLNKQLRKIQKSSEELLLKNYEIDRLIKNVEIRL